MLRQSGNHRGFGHVVGVEGIAEEVVEGGVGGPRAGGRVVGQQCSVVGAVAGLYGLDLGETKVAGAGCSSTQPSISCWRGIVVLRRRLPQWASHRYQGGSVDDR